MRTLFLIFSVVMLTQISNAQGYTCPDTLCICAGDPAPPGGCYEHLKPRWKFKPTPIKL